MGNYNFEDVERGLGETIRLESLNERIKKIEKNFHYDMSDMSETLHSVEKKKSTIERKPIANNNSNSNKNSFKPYIYLSILGGIVLFMVIFIVTFLAGRTGTGTTNTNDIVNNDDTVLVNNESECQALVIGLKGNKLNVYNLIDNEKLEFGFDRENLVIDLNGYKDIDEIKPGQILKLKLDDSNLISEICEIDSAWSINDVSNFEIDYDTEILSIDSKTYKFKNITVFVKADEIISARDISEHDTISIQGIGNVIWSVNVESGHGYLKFINSKYVNNCKYSIDGNEYLELAATELIPISVGSHIISVIGDNIDEYSEEVNVVEDEESIIYINKSLEGSYLLTVNTNVEGYTLTLDGNVVSDSNKPMIVKKGEHIVTISKPGYLTQEHKISDSGKENVEMHILMEEELKSCNYTFNSNPSGAAVLVDGVQVGKTPLNCKVEYGSHRLVIKKEGYEEISVMVDTNKEQEVLNFKMTLSND